MYFIANFQHLSDQQYENEKDRRHGSFSMMAVADSIAQAMDKFRQKLTEYNHTTTFFEGKSTIYISQLMEFEKFPEDEAIILNFKSFAGDPIMPFIACAVPTEQSNACSIHEWQQGHPVTEGQKDSVFIQCPCLKSTHDTSGCAVILFWGPERGKRWAA